MALVEIVQRTLDKWKSSFAKCTESDKRTAQKCTYSELDWSELHSKQQYSSPPLNRQWTIWTTSTLDHAGALRYFIIIKHWCRDGTDAYIKRDLLVRNNDQICSVNEGTIIVPENISRVGIIIARFSLNLGILTDERIFKVLFEVVVDLFDYFWKASFHQ